MRSLRGEPEPAAPPPGRRRLARILPRPARGAPGRTIRVTFAIPSSSALHDEHTSIPARRRPARGPRIAAHRAEAGRADDGHCPGRNRRDVVRGGYPDGALPPELAGRDRYELGPRKRLVETELAVLLLMGLGVILEVMWGAHGPGIGGIVLVGLALAGVVCGWLSRGTPELIPSGAGTVVMLDELPPERSPRRAPDGRLRRVDSSPGVSRARVGRRRRGHGRDGRGRDRLRRRPEGERRRRRLARPGARRPP